MKTPRLELDPALTSRSLDEVQNGFNMLSAAPESIREYPRAPEEFTVTVLRRVLNNSACTFGLSLTWRAPQDGRRNLIFLN